MKNYLFQRNRLSVLKCRSYLLCDNKNNDSNNSNSDDNVNRYKVTNVII